MKTLRILSVAELRSKNLSFLKTYKAAIIKAKLSAATDLEREQYTNQIGRVNCVLNEVEAAAFLAGAEIEERKFAKINRDIDNMLSVATDNLKQPIGALTQ